MGEVITRWPAAREEKFKVPTQICYGSDGRPAGWGYDIAPGSEAISWFKLLLIDEDRLDYEYRNSAAIQKAREQVARAGKEPVDVVADYLRCLWKHVLQDLVRSRGHAAVEGSPFKIWLTVPAIWDDVAGQRMKEAARRAGLLERRLAGPTQIDIVAEPEAAALAALGDLNVTPDVKVRKLRNLPKRSS